MLLDRIGAFFAGADSNDLLHIGDEDLAVSDLVRLGGVQDGVDHTLGHVVLDHDVESHLREKIDHILGTAVELSLGTQEDLAPAGLDGAARKVERRHGDCSGDLLEAEAITSQGLLRHLDRDLVVSDTGDLDLRVVDALRVSSFDALDDALRQVVFALCAPSVSLTKVDDAGTPVPGWTFHGSVDVAPTGGADQYEWVSPSLGVTPDDGREPKEPT